MRQLPLQIHLFGRFSVRCDGGSVAILEARKVQELFCYLLIHRDRPHFRESLAGVLWSEKTIAQSRKYLRQALWELQVDLAAVKTTGCDLFKIEAEWISLNPAADIWVDTATFQQAFNATHGIMGEKLAAEQAQLLDRAVCLYTGQLLEGYYQDWCLFARERLENMYFSVLDKLMGYCEVNLEFEKGVDYAALALREDRAHERTHQRLMRLYYTAGDRAGALRQYERCIQALQEELDVKPSPNTVALYAHIKANRALTTNALTAVPASNRASTSSLSTIRHGLEELLVVLSTLEEQFRDELPGDNL